MAFDIGSALAGGGVGGLGGAGAGALLGSVVPGIGTAIGAGVGGLAGLLGGFFGSQGKEAERGVQSRFSPENQALFDQRIKEILSRGQAGLDQFSFDPIEQRARTQFQEQTLPSIQTRLTGLGAGAGRSSGGLEILGQAGAGLEEGLAAQRAQFGLQKQQLMQQLLGLGAQEPYYQPRTPSFMESAAPAILQGLGSAAGGYLSGPSFASRFRGLAPKAGVQ
jgi:hypothetical protein